MTLEFGNQMQVNWINEMKEPEIIADKYSRDDSQRYYERKFPEIMFRKNFNHEPLRWVCPMCGVENFIRGFGYYNSGGYSQFMPIITPRIYLCHNSRCDLKRFYYRDQRNTLWARYVGKFEEINELDFKSSHDPLKFYDDLPLVACDPKQTNLFS